MKPNQRLLVMLPFLAIAAYLAFFADKEPADAISEPVRTVSAAAEVAGAAVPRSSEETAANEVMARLNSRTAIQSELGRQDVGNAFEVKTPPPAAAGDGAQEQAPSQPSFAYQYIGRELSQGRWKIFFEHDGEAIIATQNTNLGEFRLSKIEAQRITVTHVPSGTQQVIVTEGEQ